MLASQIKTASQLRAFVEETESHFFDRASMRFFGDTMKNYGVRRLASVETLSGDQIPVFELYRRRPVKNGLQSSSYFCVVTFRRVFVKKETV